MKKFSLIFIFVIIISLSLGILPTASADQQSVGVKTYYKIENEGTYFRHNANPECALFEITVGAYVEILGDSGDYYQVAYKYSDLRGYVKKSDITNTHNYASEIVNPYPSDVNILALSSGNLFRDYPESQLQNTVSVTSGDELKLLGKYEYNDTTFLYVYHAASNTYGAINKANTDWIEANEPILAPTQPTQNPGNGGNGGNGNTNVTEDPSNNLVRVLLIIGICVPALLIVFLIFKPVRPDSGRYATENPKRRTQDFDDYE